MRHNAPRSPCTCLPAAYARWTRARGLSARADHGMEYSATPLRFAPGQPSRTPPLPSQAVLVTASRCGQSLDAAGLRLRQGCPGASPGVAGLRPHRPRQAGACHALGPGLRSAAPPGLMAFPRSGIAIRCMGWTPTHRRRTRSGLQTPRFTQTEASRRGCRRQCRHSARSRGRQARTPGVAPET